LVVALLFGCGTEDPVSSGDDGGSDGQSAAGDDADVEGLDDGPDVQMAGDDDVADGGSTVDVAPDVPAGEGAIVLNEILARNAKGLTDDDGKTSDWIELHNPGDGPMDLEGWAVTDLAEEPQKWLFPDVTVEAGGYLVVFASGKDKREPTGTLHTNFKLAGGGEFLGLTDPSGAIVQNLGESVPPQLEDVSYGLHAGPGLFYLEPPTPGASNLGSEASVGLGEVSFSKPSGLFTEAFELSLSGPPLEQLRVTLDGTEPTAESPPYDGPIAIVGSAQVRVAIIDDEDVRRSSATYVWADAEVTSFQSTVPVVVIESLGFDIDDEAELEERPFRPLSILVFEDASAGLSGQPTWSGAGAMHVRGSSSAQYPKKQYTLETRDERDRDHDVPLLGMPAESDWVLHAPYSDKSLVRNAMMYKWSNAIDRYAVRTRHLELFVVPHGAVATLADYRGVYVLMEKIKRGPERVDVANLTEDDVHDPEISGGYLLKKDWWDEGFDTAIYNDHLIWVDPDVDTIQEEQADWINGYFNAFEAALAGPDFADPWIGYSRFIDVDSFIDHHLMVELARNVDGYVLSTFLHKDREGRIQMGPIWDYNGSLGGADYFCSWLTDGWHHTFDEAWCGGGGESFPADNAAAYLWYERLFEDPWFAEHYADRWALHRAGAWSTVKLHADIDHEAGALSAAAGRNFVRWPVLGQYVWPNAPGWAQRTTFDSEVAYLKTWLEGRLAWMDEQLLSTP